MAVRITDICISCNACLNECPVEAIVDNYDNPTNEDIYFVDKNKCVECVGYNEIPACADACPTEGCIIWGEEENYETTSEKRNPGKQVI